jgi:hypothetical protein
MLVEYVLTREQLMTLLESQTTPVRKPRTGKKSISVVEAKIDLRLHAELYPPLRDGANHTVDIKRGTQGVVCGAAPNGDDYIVAFNYARHHSATAIVGRKQVIRLSA